MAKYIIDIEDEYTKDWVNETPMRKELCMPISVPNRQRTYHVTTGFKLEPYTEPDRKAIEDERGIARSWEETGKIIRCKDCIHYTPLGIDGAWGRCTIHSSPTENQRMCQEVDYCSWAERRGEEE